MKRTLAILMLFFAFSFISRAQEGIPVYFDYLSDNYYLVHPSMAGIGEGGKLRLTARKQWFDVVNAPNLQTFNAHYRVGENSGLGGILFNDANGFHSQTGIKLTYAHHLRFSRDMRNLNQLSFGLSPTILLSSLDESEFRSILVDNAISGVKTTAAYYNVDFGISYNFMEFYTHFSVLNALESKRELYRIGRTDDPDNLGIPRVDNLRRYLLSVGYVFGKSEWQIEPSVLLQLTEFTEEKTIDINAKVYREVGFGRVWAGLSYRRSFDGAQFQQNGTLGEQRLQLFTPIVGVNVNNFMFSYNYSYQSGDIRLDNGGFHQITLGYDFGQETAKRYDCKCPAVNY
ncbi:PorP/SprF family type IX secretion system membrane protein [Costertonia aggregata]|uniref:Type IX secretion system membrane protein PorP/SprF n=1 Tax=Costertonia aggregata TaxID=343403 RepID=A0A7H9AM45_9FLAO|nr:type IX secretion system membrane protein PorP/SprF [Costertonia aggregata]QLG44522.1 type IX secretion system membrane protein PorP/SprF [Costertonia aggregata]